jgi:hypothetical protein
MIEHIWTVLCSQSVVDKDTNNISLFNVMEQLVITGPPVPEGQVGLIPLNLEVVSLWNRANETQPNRGQVHLRLIDPSGNSLGIEIEYMADVSIHTRARTIAKIAGLSFRGPGVYQFCVQFLPEGETVWKDIVRIPLQITLGLIQQ